MADMLSPAVKVTEVRKGPITLPSSPNGTIAAFVLASKKGPGGGLAPKTPVLVTSEADFLTKFGGPITGGYGYESVRGFFANGGKACYVSRALHYSDVTDATTYDAVIGSRQLVDGAGTPQNTILVKASSPGAWSLQYKITTLRRSVQYTTTAEDLTALASVTSVLLTTATRVQVGDLLSLVGSATVYVTVTSISGNRVYFAAQTVPAGGVASGSPASNCTFDLTVLQADNSIERVYSDLRMSSLSSRYFKNIIDNSADTQIVVTDNASATTDARPANVTAVQLTSGADGTTPVAADYVGSAAAKTGIYAMDDKSDFGMMAVPGISSTSLVQALIDYAESRKRFVAIPDMPAGTSISGAVTFVATTVNRYSSYAAIYYSWVKVMDAAGSGAKVTVPNSGFVCGVYSRTHVERGPWKSPAGGIDGALRGVVELEYSPTETDYDTLYPAKINALQNVPGFGNCVMGNVTLDPTGEFGEVGVRRSFLYVEEAIRQGIRFVQFEDNVASTWAKVVRVVRTFLREYWRDGGLQGSKESDAFFVQCDNTLNDATTVASRKLKVRVGLAAVHAAEFVDTTVEQQVA